MADLHIMPALGSDSLYLRALIAVILEKGWQNQEYLNKYTRDFSLILPWFKGFDIDAALEVCQVSREQTEKFARILTTKKWGMHRDLGLFFGRHSTASSYLCLLLAVVCGVALVKGGCVMPERVLYLDNSDELDPKTWRTPVTNRFPVSCVFPEGVFPDEVLGDNEDRIRMAFSVLTNPARSYPDSQKMEEALRALLSAHEGGVTLLRHGERTEPLMGVYDCTLAPLCEEILRTEHTGVWQLLNRTTGKTLPFDGDEAAFTNGNTPEEYVRLLQLWERGETL